MPPGKKGLKGMNWQVAYRGLDGSCLLSDRLYHSRAITTWAGGSRLSGAKRPREERQRRPTACFRGRARHDPLLQEARHRRPLPYNWRAPQCKEKTQERTAVLSRREESNCAWY